jgi:hypothetical protein
MLLFLLAPGLMNNKNVSGEDTQVFPNVRRLLIWNSRIMVTPEWGSAKTSPENTIKSEVTTWTGQLLKIDQNWFHKQHNSKFRKNRRVMYSTNKAVTSGRSSESEH